MVRGYPDGMITPHTASLAARGRPLLPEPASVTIPILAKALACGVATRTAPWVVAEKLRGPPAVERILKSTVTASGTDAAGALLNDVQAASTSFFNSLSESSVFAALLPNFQRVPFNERLGILSLAASAWAKLEGKAVPLSKVTLGDSTLQPRDVVALIVLTNSVAEDLSAGGQAFLSRALKEAAAACLDTQLFASLLDTGLAEIAFAAESNDVAIDALLHLRRMLDICNRGLSPRLVWVFARDVANAAACLCFGGGGAAFPEMTPGGGTILGLRTFVSPQLSTGEVLLIDCSQIAANTGELKLDAGRHAAIQLDDTPTNDAVAPTATEVLSLFQTNCVALRVKMPMAAQKMSDAAVVKLTGCDAWGQVVTG